MTRPIPVTRPSLPPLEEFTRYLEEIWESGILTHNGPFLHRFEDALRAYLDTEHVVAVTSGTIAIQLAIRALDLEGEIITTPFTWIATAAAIQWERCTPVLADVDPDSWNIDPEQIEAKITPATTAILGVHVFSNPCDVEAIDAIAARHGLKVVYDAAHAMCVQLGGRSLLEYGDVSATSFHATKILQSAEGGACVTTDGDIAERIRRLRFFGFDERKEVVDVGFNGKMTEVHAALGLASLAHMDRVRATRRIKYELYQERLADRGFLRFQSFPRDSYNYSYLPVVFDTEERLLATVASLERQGIQPRRYFHPALNQIPILGPQGSFPVAERIARCVLCLPLYDRLPEGDIERICAIMRG